MAEAAGPVSRGSLRSEWSGPVGRLPAALNQVHRSSPKALMETFTSVVYRTQGLPLDNGGLSKRPRLQFSHKATHLQGGLR